MKKLLLLVAIATGLTAHAQITNGGFEDLNSQDFPQYWQGNLVLLAITIDSLGVSHGDSVVFDGGGWSNYLLNTTDVHAGNNAVELVNGYNFTAGSPIPGSWSASTDSANYGGFPLVYIGVQQQPLSLNFWSKYLPAGNDAATVSLEVFDETQSSIGTGSLTISGTVPQYTSFSVPITYTSSAAAAYLTLSFSTYTPGADVTLGTRLLIDDVALTSAPQGIADAGTALEQLGVFPNPAQNTFSLASSTGALVQAMSAVDASGRSVALSRNADGTFDSSALVNGLYSLRVLTAKGESRAKLAIQR